MNILTAPILALFDIKFYRKVIQASLTKGFLYILYLAFLASLIYGAFFLTRALPRWENLAGWVKAEMPTLQWTHDGLTMNKPNPYVMTHPEYGPLVAFDMSKDEVTLEEIGPVRFFVTSRKLYIHPTGSEDSRMVDLTKRFENEGAAGKNPNASITPEIVGKFMTEVRPILIGTVYLFSFVGFILWKIGAVFFYSLIGVILNSIRVSKLKYSQILNLTFFALTPTLWSHFIFLWLRGSMQPPLGVFGNLMLMTLYMFLIFKNTDQAKAV